MNTPLFSVSAISRILRRPAFAALGCGVVLVGLAIGSALVTPAYAANTLRKDINNATAGHTLTEAEVQRLADVVEDAKSNNRNFDITSTNPTSLEDMVNTLEGRPKVMDVLERHDFGARDYLVSVMTLSRSVMAARMGQGSVHGISPENVQFVKSHPALISKLVPDAKKAGKQ